MSIHSRGSAAARIAPGLARQRGLATSETTEAYVANSPSLAAEPLVADHTHALPDYRTAAVPQTPDTRAFWLLVVWLCVSVATITGAVGVIINYF